MAVAYSTSTNGGYSGSGTTRTFSHTTSGSDNYTLVGSWTRSSGANAVTGITYNGVAMTALGTEISPNNSSGTEYIRFWGLAVGTGVGAANVVISCPTGMESIVFAVSYTGCSQTGQPDATSNQAMTTQTNTVCTVTTVADNSYAVVLARNQSGSGSAGTNATFRVYGLSSSGTACFDRGTLSPAGSYSLTVNHSSNKAGYQMVSIKPPGASTQISSINGVSQASISSFNGVALASIGSAMGVSNT